MHGENYPTSAHSASPTRGQHLRAFAEKTAKEIGDLKSKWEGATADNVEQLRREIEGDGPLHRLLTERAKRKAVDAVPSKTESDMAAKFIAGFFDARTTAPVCIASYANLKNEAKLYSPQHLYTRDPAKIRRFASKWDVPGRSTYFSVNTIKQGKSRDKENVAEITALHADLDFKNIIETREQIEAVIEHLPVQPNVINFSGHGLHLYLKLLKALPATEKNKTRVEAALMKLAEVLAGDPGVAEVARVMRLPGTHNSKFGEWKKCITVKQRDGGYTLEEIEEWLKDAKPLLTRKPKKGQQEKTTGNSSADYLERFGKQYARHQSLDIEELLDALEFNGAGGGGNVHETVLKISASMLSRNVPIPEIFNFLEDEFGKRIPESRNWNWNDDSDSYGLRDQCVTWFVKHPELLERQHDQPDWLGQDRRIKKVVKELKAKAEAADEAAAARDLYFEDLLKLPEKPLDWIVEDFILAEAVNGLFGDGGVGKDLLLLMLGVAMTSDAKWLGREVQQGRVLYMPVEDSLEELRRRAGRIKEYFERERMYHPRRGELLIRPMVGQDTVLAAFDARSGVAKATAQFETVRRLIGEFKPTLVIVGNRVNIFGVSQIDDAQARQCMTLLSSLTVDYRTAVIMPGHVSVAGAATGTSGSVQWSNACRVRSYLSRIKDEKTKEEDDVNRRQVEVMKANWSPTGEIITMEWRDGVFKPDAEPLVIHPGETEVKAEKRAQAEEDQKVEAVFLRLLGVATISKNNVSAQISAPNNAPKVFSKDASSKYRGEKGRVLFKSAMERLLLKGIIRSVNYGPPSHYRSRLEIAVTSMTAEKIIRASNLPSNLPSNPKK